jgi:hypothetical protein
LLAVLRTPGRQWPARRQIVCKASVNGWALSVSKFLVIWGVPALALGAPLFVLSRVERRRARSVARQGA